MATRARAERGAAASRGVRAALRTATRSGRGRQRVNTPGVADVTADPRFGQSSFVVGAGFGTQNASREGRS